jgi:hypothetical protein
MTRQIKNLTACIYYFYNYEMLIYIQFRFFLMYPVHGLYVVIFLQWQCGYTGTIIIII